MIQQVRKYILVVVTLFIASISLSAQEILTAFDKSTTNRSGFINIEDTSKNIAPVYFDANSFSEGLAAVKNQSKWGFIDANNNVVIPFGYDGARSFRQGRSIVRQGEFYGVINKCGSFVIPPVYYDLMPYELGGEQYYISRDSTFFQGIIDSSGREIIHHRYTYIITLEPNITTGRRFYKNIPFYTVFQEIDSSKGTFYEQFKENAFQFSPEKGRQDIYDLHFNKLASRFSTNYSDGFQHEQLLHVDAFLDENGNRSVGKTREGIDSLLARHVLPESVTPKKAYDTAASYQRMSEAQVQSYLKELGYKLYKQNEKTGLKKGNKILIQAQYADIQFVNGVIHNPSREDVSLLTNHYGGRYRNRKEGIFDIFVVLQIDNNANKINQYSLSGEITIPCGQADDEGKKLLTRLTSIGFLYLHTKKKAPSGHVSDVGVDAKTYSLINWEGKQLVPPIYRKIEVLETGHMLATQEAEDEKGIKEQFTLISPKGKKIIPLGLYSEIRPFGKRAQDLYLATLRELNPVEGGKKGSKVENRKYVILKAEGDFIKTINTFSANAVYPWSLDVESGMLRYRKKAE